MMKKLFQRTVMVCGTAAVLMAGGLSAAAVTPEEVPVPLTEATAVTIAEEERLVTVSVTEGDAGYDIVLTDTNTKDDSQKKSPNWGMIIPISLVISLVVTGIAVWMIYRGYKYNGMTEPYEFKNKAPLDLKEREDDLIDVHVTSVHINRGNDN